MDVVMWQITCGRILFSPLSENLFHEAVCGCIVRDYGGNADHDDLVGVLLIDFCSRYMKLVLQLCNVQSAVSLLD